MKRILLSLALLFALTAAPNLFAQPLKERLTFQGPKGGITARAISPDGKYIALAGKNAIHLHDAVTGKVLGTLKTSALSLAFSADGARLAIVDQEKWGTVARVPDLSPLAALGAHALGQVRKGERGPLAFTADGQVIVAHVVSGKEKKDGAAINWAEVRILDIAAGTSRKLLRGTSPEALPGIGVNFRPLAFSPDGRLLAVGSEGAGANYDVTIVETATGKKLRTLPLARDAVLAFSKDGKTLATTERHTSQSEPTINGKPVQPVIWVIEQRPGKRLDQ